MTLLKIAMDDCHDLKLKMNLYSIKSPVFSMCCRPVISLLVLFLISQGATSQFIYYDPSASTDWSQVNTFLASGREIRDSLQDAGQTAETFIIHHVGNKIWMSVDGRFDVFEWTGNIWVNLYKGTHHGYNHGSEKFTFRDRLFSYRGYGFWREHGEIIEFLPEKGGWEIIPSSKELPFGIGYVSDSLFYIHADKCFTVNLLHQNFSPAACRYTVRGEIPRGRVYTFRDFILVASFLQDGSQFPLIDKNNGDVYLSSRQPFKALRDAQIINGLVHVRDNDMRIFFENGRVITYHVKDELKYYLRERDSVPRKKDLVWVAMAILGMAGGGLLFYRRDRPVKTMNVDSLEAFKALEGKLIDSDTLDAILGIQDIVVYETRKFKRASLIKELNILSQSRFGKELILREKNPVDKRFYLYRIQPVHT